MLFRPLSLALPITLAFANPLVGHNKFTALQTALMDTNSTIYAIYQDLNVFAINVDSAHAMVRCVVVRPSRLSDALSRQCTTAQRL